MATSSIFTSFDIKDRKTAEAFAEALDKSYHDPERIPTSPPPVRLTDKEEIRKRFSK